MIETSHDPRTIVEQLFQTLSADKLSIGFLIGAGCPSALRCRDNSPNEFPLIPSIAGLTETVTKNFAAGNELAHCYETLVRSFDEDGHQDPNVEFILSRIRIFHDAAGKGEVRGLNSEKLAALDSRICDVIREVVDQRLPVAPPHQTPYHSFAKFVAGDRVLPTELFTTNYDLLAEQALEAAGVPYFDGFVETVDPFFYLTAIEEDPLPARWCRLWKIHGSINWHYDASARRVRRTLPPRNETGEELLIHPSHRKYDENRRMPYLVMLDRLKAFVRGKRGARGEQQPVAMLALGHSFSDAHLNETVFESLRANPASVCYAIQYGELQNYESLSNAAVTLPNLDVIARDGAIISRRQGPWMMPAMADSLFNGDLFTCVESGEESAEWITCESHLGDFGVFGSLLGRIVDRDIKDSANGTQW